MKKKEYITPEMMVVKMTTIQMIAYSGESNQGIKTDDEPDDEIGYNRSRQHSVWDDEEEDY